MLKKNKIILDLQLACSNSEKIPKKHLFIRWTQYVFSSLNKKIELTIRIVDEEESRLLNMYFLQKNFATNVLSFPFEAPAWINTSLIGDLVICQKIIEYEARIYKVSIDRYMAYVVIHGALHLIGYNHTTDSDSKIMKNLENKIMKKLGYINIDFLHN